MVLLAFAAPENGELHRLRDFLEAMPGMELGDVVLADEINEMGVGMLLPDFPDGIHRVARPGAVDLALVENEARLARDGCADHLHTSLRAGRPAPELVRRDGGGKEDNTIKAHKLHRVAGEDQMPVMNRVESAAVKGETHWLEYAARRKRKGRMRLEGNLSTPAPPAV